MSVAKLRAPASSDVDESGTVTGVEESGTVTGVEESGVVPGVDESSAVTGVDESEGTDASSDAAGGVAPPPELLHLSGRRRRRTERRAQEVRRSTLSLHEGARFERVSPRRLARSFLVSNILRAHRLDERLERIARAGPAGGYSLALITMNARA